MTQEFGLPKEKFPIVAVTDAGSNMIKATELLGLKHLNCFAHGLHNSIKKGLDKPELKQIIEKSRKIVTLFKMSYKKQIALSKMQNSLKMAELKLKLDVSTRWNSIFLMLERLMANRKALVNLSLEEKGEKKKFLPYYYHPRNEIYWSNYYRF